MIVAHVIALDPTHKQANAMARAAGCARLSEREYVCEACGVCEDRDRNASINLEMYTGLS